MKNHDIQRGKPGRKLVEEITPGIQSGFSPLRSRGGSVSLLIKIRIRCARFAHGNGSTQLYRKSNNEVGVVSYYAFFGSRVYFLEKCSILTSNIHRGTRLDRPLFQNWGLFYIERQANRAFGIEEGVQEGTGQMTKWQPQFLPEG